MASSKKACPPIATIREDGIELYQVRSSHRTSSSDASNLYESHESSKPQRYKPIPALESSNSMRSPSNGPVSTPTTSTSVSQIFSLNSTAPTSPSDVSEPSSLGSQLLPRFSGAATQSVVLTCPTRRSHPWAKRECLRKGKGNRRSLYLYPFSSRVIPKEYNQHLDQAARILYEEINDPSRIEIQPMMCGSDPSTAEAAMVVICFQKDLMEETKKKLTKRDILAKCHLAHEKAQRTMWDYLSRRSEPLVDHDPNLPKLRLYFYTGEPSEDYNATEDVENEKMSEDCGLVNSASWQKWAFCGTTIVNSQRSKSARMTCAFRVGSVWCGLAAAHTFNDSCSDMSLIDGLDPFRNARTSRCTVIFEDNRESIETSIKLPRLDSGASSIPNLDWGLVLLGEEILRICGQTTSSDSDLCEHADNLIAQEHPQEEREVSILCSETKSRNGTLLVGNTYRITQGSGLIQLWSVELDDGEELFKGDSGSLVIDNLTGQAYGYFVSIDIFGKAQIIPLHAAISQIRDFTGVKDIHMANASKCVSKLAPRSTSTHLSQDAPERLNGESRSKKRKLDVQESKPLDDERQQKIARTTSGPVEDVTPPMNLPTSSDSQTLNQDFILKQLVEMSQQPQGIANLFRQLLDLEPQEQQRLVWVMSQIRRTSEPLLSGETVVEKSNHFRPGSRSTTPARASTPSKVYSTEHLPQGNRAEQFNNDKAVSPLENTFISTETHWPTKKYQRLVGVTNKAQTSISESPTLMEGTPSSARLPYSSTDFTDSALGDIRSSSSGSQEKRSTNRTSERTLMFIEKQRFANLYRGYQKEFRLNNSHGDGRFKCTLGCDWAHQMKSNWQRHELAHYPQEIWVCFHKDCLHASDRSRVSLRRDVACHHYADYHARPGESRLTEEDLYKSVVIVADSLFPRECVFKGCHEVFDTWKERSGHTEWHLMKGDKLERNRIVKRIFPDETDFDATDLAVDVVNEGDDNNQRHDDNDEYLFCSFDGRTDTDFMGIGADEDDSKGPTLGLLGGIGSWPSPGQPTSPAHTERTKLRCTGNSTGHRDILSQ